jgi:pimeloyl-ACP methyl ester carboxylesterase
MGNGSTRATTARPTPWGRALRALLLLSLIWGLSVTALPAATATAAAPTPVTTGVPRYEAAPCVYRLGKGQTEGQSVTCGYIVVAEKHANPGGTTIKLPVAIYKSLSATPAAEPIILLAGGPGQSGQVFATLMTADSAFYKGAAANHDVIFFDQRGTGKSQPSLQCPEVNALTLKGTPVLQAFADTPLVAAMNKCRDRLVGMGIDLSAYTTTENAADVNDVRIALGYPAMDLLGASYGSELGLAVTRDFGQFVRTNNQASIVPLQETWFFEPPQNFDRAINELFRDCGADAACNAAYPNLKAAFQSTVATLNDTPQILTLKDPASGQVVKVPLDGDTYTALLFQLFYATPLIPFLPDAMTRASRGDFVWLENLLPLILDDGSDPTALGMHFSVVCSKNPTQAQLDAATAADQNILPEVRAALEPQSVDYFNICATWPSRNADPKANIAVTSDRPTTLISGQFDPVTPPSYADTAKATLSNATSVTLTGGGHSAIAPGEPVGACGFNIMTSNIANPGKPDTACAAALKTTYRPLPNSIAGGPTPSPSPAPSASPTPSASPVPSPVPSPSVAPSPVPSPVPPSSPIPSPPPTGNGGYLPGLPNTGAGGSSGTSGIPGWVILLPFIALGAGLVPLARRVRRRAA